MKANPTQSTPAIPMGAKSNNLQNPTSKIQEDKIDFKTLLENSNLEAQKSRGKQKEDLSDFDTYEDFLEHLHKESQTKEKPSKELNQDNFLKLFVTQLQNQNPLDPKDGAEMASQLAQFNSLEQMVNMNSKLESLEKLTAKGQNNNLTSYIGKEVTINDGRIKLADDKISYLALKTQAPTEQVTIEIRDARNQVVLNEKIGNLSPGDHQIDWDGRNLKGEKLPNGSYSISAYSEQKDGSTQPITTTYLNNS